MMILILSLWIVTIGTFQNSGEVSWFFVFGEVEGLSSLNLMTTIAKRGRGHRREQSMSSTWRWLTTMRLGRKRFIMGRWRVTSNLLPLAYILSNLLKNLTCSAVYEVVHVVGQVNHYVSHQRQPAAVGQTLPGDTNQIDQATHLRHTLVKIIPWPRSRQKRKRKIWAKTALFASIKHHGLQ